MTDSDTIRPEQVECFPIRTVAAMTGISAVTLRAWERRYGLIEPARTESGHRLYTGEHVALIRRVVRLLERGVPIGRVAALLAEGVADDAMAGVATQQVDDQAQSSGWGRHQQEMMAAIAQFDEARLNEVYNEALSLYPLEVVNQRLVMPTLRGLGEPWRERPVGIAEEHFFSTFLRNKMGARFHHLSLSAKGPRLLAACVPGERHELGLLMFCLAASHHGYRVVMLGQSMPTLPLAPAVRSVSACAVVLSTTREPSAQTLKDLSELTATVAVPVFLGGAVGPAGIRAVERVGVTFVGRAFLPALERIDAVLDDVRGGRPS